MANDLDNLSFERNTNLDSLSFEPNTEDLTFNNLATDDFTSITTQIDDKGLVILFHFIEDETSVMEASITDNYVETNHAVQDHIAIKPRIYRLRGCVGEVIYKGSSEWLNAITEKINSNPVLKKTVAALQPIGAVSSIIGNGTATVINLVNHLENSYNRYKQMIENNFISAKQKVMTGKIQESVVADLNRILELRIPVNLKGLKFENTLDDGNDYKRLYYLQSVSAHQGNNNYISDIEITIKEFRIATTRVTTLDKKQYGQLTQQKNTSAIQKAAEVNQGTAQGQKVETEKNFLQKVGEKGKKVVQQTCNEIQKEMIIDMQNPFSMGWSMLKANPLTGSFINGIKTFANISSMLRAGQK